MAGLVLLASLVGTAQMVADSRLRPDWNDLVSAAARNGLILTGTPEDGWTGLHVHDATLAGPPAVPNAAIGALTLHRSVGDLFRLSVTFDAPVTLVFPSGEQDDVWSRALRLRRIGGVWHIEGSGVAFGDHGGGPDDVTSIEHLAGDLRESPAGWRVALAARDLALPARGTWPDGRLVERAAATLHADAASGALVLDDTALSWGGQTATLTFRGRLDDRGLLAGRGEATLGPGWAATFKRAHAAGVLDAGAAEAAIGFLGLLQPNERSAVSFPVNVNAGAVAIGRTTLFMLPRLPVAR